MKLLSLIIISVTIMIATPVEAGYDNLNKLINARRSYNLVSSPVLDQVAFCRAKYLFINKLWTHYGFQKCFNKHKIYNYYGEILAKGNVPDEVLVEAWMSSLSHRNNMLSDWSFIGSSKYGDITVVTFR